MSVGPQALARDSMRGQLRDQLDQINSAMDATGGEITMITDGRRSISPGGAPRRRLP